MGDPDRRGTLAVSARSTPRGFTLVDVTVTLTVSVILLLALHTGTRTALRTRRAVEKAYQVHLVAADLLGRLRRLPFGNPGSPRATESQLDELFDADQDLGSVSLTQLLVPPQDDGYSFAVTSQEITGTWRVRVTADLNGDGDVRDDREGRTDLLRSEVYYDDHLILESLLAAAPAMTVVDRDTNWIAGLPPPPGRRRGLGRGRSADPTAHDDHHGDGHGTQSTGPALHASSHGR